jgi:hypothetical protein
MGDKPSIWMGSGTKQEHAQWSAKLNSGNKLFVKPLATGFGAQQTTEQSTGLFGSPTSTATAAFRQPSRANAFSTPPSTFGVAPSTFGAAPSTFGMQQSVPAGTTIKFMALTGTDTMKSGGIESYVNTRCEIMQLWDVFGCWC